MTKFDENRLNVLVVSSKFMVGVIVVSELCVLMIVCV